MPYIPLLSSTLPPATPGPHKTIGYAVVRAPAREWSLASPVFKAPFKRAGEPALQIRGSTWAVYYPATTWDDAASQFGSSPSSISAASRPQGHTSSPSPGWSQEAAAWGSTLLPAPLRGWWTNSSTEDGAKEQTPKHEATVQWIPEPVGGILSGYDRYFRTNTSWLHPIVKHLATRFQIPVSRNLPLKPTDTPYPLVIFSHGMCGTRTTYSQWCQAIASEGYVVLAVEHGDGSGPCVVLPDGELPYTMVDDLTWGEDRGSRPPSTDLTVAASSEQLQLSASALSTSEPGDPAVLSQTPGRTRIDLHALQLDQRVRELHVAHEAFTAMLAGSEVNVDGLSSAQARSWASTFTGNVDVTDPAFAGHSFGAATVLRALEAPPVDYPPLSLRAVLALDHWYAPFTKLAHRPRPPTSVPVLAINSQEYTESEQWANVVRHCQDIGAGLVTILGTTHVSFCDFPVICTLSPTTELGYLASIHELSMALLEGTLGELAVMRSKPDGGEYGRGSGGTMVGQKGEIVVHLPMVRAGGHGTVADHHVEGEQDDTPAKDGSPAGRRPN